MRRTADAEVAYQDTGNGDQGARGNPGSDGPLCGRGFWRRFRWFAFIFVNVFIVTVVIVTVIIATVVIPGLIPGVLVILVPPVIAALVDVGVIEIAIATAELCFRHAHRLALPGCRSTMSR